MKGVRGVFEWLADRLIPPPLGSPGLSEQEVERRQRQQVGRESRATVNRVNRVVDEWNEKIKQSWEPE